MQAQAATAASLMYAAVPNDLVELQRELDELGGGDARLGRLEVLARVAPAAPAAGAGTVGAGSEGASVWVAADNSTVCVSTDRNSAAARFETSCAVPAFASDAEALSALGALLSSCGVGRCPRGVRSGGGTANPPPPSHP
jgi:hypothetical protein